MTPTVGNVDFIPILSGGAQAFKGAELAIVGQSLKPQGSSSQAEIKTVEDLRARRWATPVGAADYDGRDLGTFS